MSSRPGIQAAHRAAWTALVIGLLCLSVADAQEVPSDSGGTPVAPAAGLNSPAKARVGIPKNPLEVLYALGPFMYPLGLCSVIVVWFCIERLVVLRRGRVIPLHFVRRFFEHIEQGKVDAKGAMKLCEENGSPIAAIFASGLKKWGKPAVEVEQAVIDGGERQVSLLRKHLRALNGCANAAPLLGLLGTVVGMIDSFNTISTLQGMGKSEELAGGIGLALLTTAVGLVIAIPAQVMYTYFASRVDGLVLEMDEVATDLVDLISAEGLAEQARLGRPPLSAAKPAEPRKAV